MGWVRLAFQNTFFRLRHAESLEAGRVCREENARCLLERHAQTPHFFSDPDTITRPRSTTTAVQVSIRSSGPYIVSGASGGAGAAQPATARQATRAKALIIRLSESS